MSAIDTIRLPKPPPAWTLPEPRQGRHGVAHHRRVGDFHDLRGGLSVLSRQEPRPDRRRAKCCEMPIFYTICLLSSSVTIHLAGNVCEARQPGRLPAPGGS